MKNLVILSGAGMSSESGLKTFRGSDGLWENYDVMEVASIEGWIKNPGLVSRFYNERRRQLKDAKPNEGHFIIAELENQFNVNVITQNVDNLHERAGSSNVLHLHGELTKACSNDKKFVYDIGYKEISRDDKAEDGSPLRPFIVFFGEPVPMMDKAIEIISHADILLIIGTSLQVYPAAGLVDFVHQGIPIYLIDPNEVTSNKNVRVIKEKASVGMKLFFNILKDNEF